MTNGKEHATSKNPESTFAKGKEYIYDSTTGLYFAKDDIKKNEDGSYTIPVGAEAGRIEYPSSQRENATTPKGSRNYISGNKSEIGELNKQKYGSTYDSGGVLHGLGGIKATERDEMVLPPDITEKILNPQNTVAFRDFCNNLGILYGALEHTMPTRGNVITQNHTANDNRNMSRNTYINGVPISSEKADRYTISELLREMPLVREW